MQSCREKLYENDSKAIVKRLYRKKFNIYQYLEDLTKIILQSNSQVTIDALQEAYKAIIKEFDEQTNIISKLYKWQNKITLNKVLDVINYVVGHYENNNSDHRIYHIFEQLRKHISCQLGYVVIPIPDSKPIKSVKLANKVFNKVYQVAGVHIIEDISSLYQQLVISFNRSDCSFREYFSPDKNILENLLPGNNDTEIYNMILNDIAKNNSAVRYSSDFLCRVNELCDKSEIDKNVLSILRILVHINFEYQLTVESLRSFKSGNIDGIMSALVKYLSQKINFNQYINMDFIQAPINDYKICRTSCEKIIKHYIEISNTQTLFDHKMKVEATFSLACLDLFEFMRSDKVDSDIFVKIFSKTVLDLHSLGLDDGSVIHFLRTIPYSTVSQFNASQCVMIISFCEIIKKKINSDSSPLKKIDQCLIKDFIIFLNHFVNSIYNNRYLRNQSEDPIMDHSCSHNNNNYVVLKKLINCIKLAQKNFVEKIQGKEHHALSSIRLCYCEHINTNSLEIILMRHKNMKYINLRGCVNITNIRYLLTFMECEYLNLSETNIGHITIQNNNLGRRDLGAYLPSLETLILSNCKQLSRVEINHSKIKSVSLDGCVSLDDLIFRDPFSLGQLNIKKCNRLNFKSIIIASVLSKKGVIIKYYNIKEADQCLSFLASRGQIDLIKILQKLVSINPDDLDEDYLESLIYLSNVLHENEKHQKYKQEYKCIKSIIGSGGSIEVPDADGNYPIHLASMHGCPQVLSSLVILGAELELTNADDINALKLALRYKHSECISFLRGWLACERKHRLEVEPLLLKAAQESSDEEVLIEEDKVSSAYSDCEEDSDAESSRVWGCNFFNSSRDNVDRSNASTPNEMQTFIPPRETLIVIPGPVHEEPLDNSNVSPAQGNASL